MMKIVIIGGVAGGMSAATRLRRLNEDAEIIVLEKGPFVSFANCGLPYYISGDIQERSDLLVQTPEQLRARFDLDVRPFSEAIGIDADKKEEMLHGENALNNIHRIQPLDLLTYNAIDSLVEFRVAAVLIPMLKQYSRTLPTPENIRALSF